MLAFTFYFNRILHPYSGAVADLGVKQTLKQLEIFLQALLHTEELIYAAKSSMLHGLSHA